MFTDACLPVNECHDRYETPVEVPIPTPPPVVLDEPELSEQSVSGPVFNLCLAMVVLGVAIVLVGRFGGAL
jgi:hypothetical protein